MHLVQILLPTTDASTSPFPPELFASVRDELTRKFGGITFHRSAPAEGLWLSDDGVEKDAIVTAEVMVDEIDREWWTSFRVDLERRFDQEEIVIRALPITRI
ncbi:hypothetical protein RHAB21_03386 [Pseudorhizobium halotolerans]|uniref:Uncharacterized protein n=1 Tax=Pseudorhizobium halotolerans TaxID=1233081 RepID=A0ABN7JR74_9HYPH|nr:hypothetical protein [Pseudorhizobium halotolerans]CAD7043997.1 hypothetical protein RHAB21_03386 [Pseudorhizobium halotolerans]